MSQDLILAIDQGTTGNHVHLFNREGREVSSGYAEFRQYYPRPGWVEHDAEEIYRNLLQVIRQTLEKKEIRPSRIVAIGITNQRETFLLWSRRDGKPLSKAIVWQCRRTSDLCASLKKKGLEKRFSQKTGLCLDPYFSGTKVKWLLDHLSGSRKKARQGKILFGTIDSWLLWKLTGGAVHATDLTNASRTLLLNIQQKKWDRELLELLEIPEAFLPSVFPSRNEFGKTARQGPLPAGIPITGMAGDQQAALFGQGGWGEGSAKNTYGTGCFLLLNTGKKRIVSRHGLLTTLACGKRGESVFALEGSVFIAGAAIQWLRDGLKVLSKASDSEKIAKNIPNTGGLYVVPAFVGLGAPYWNPFARGGIFGLTRGTERAHLIRATLESIAYQTKDLVEAMQKDIGNPIRSLRVDGGATQNRFLMQFQADILQKKIIRSPLAHLTARGAAFLAGLTIGFWKDEGELEKILGKKELFQPKIGKRDIDQRYRGWKQAVASLLAHATLLRQNSPVKSNRLRAR